MADIKIKIYLDTNVYGRPFDDISQTRVKLEAASAVDIFRMMREGTRVESVSSDILTMELMLGDPLKRTRIIPLIALSRTHVEETEEVRKRAHEVQAVHGTHPKDSLHLASALIAGAQYFITCDDRILKRADDIVRNFQLKVTNPVQFIHEHYANRTTF